MKTVLITGAHGFIGRNLSSRLRETSRFEVIDFGHADDDAALADAVRRADFVAHLAGVNRPQDPGEFEVGNARYTRKLCDAISSAGRAAPVIYASSTQAAVDNPYGASKRAAEDALLHYAAQAGAPVHIFRLTNVFGRWARVNYKSAVATFCHNISHDLPVTIHDPAAKLRFLYVDDVVDAFVDLLDSPPPESGFRDVASVYETTVGELVAIIRDFRAADCSTDEPALDGALERALHATYVSYLDQDADRTASENRTPGLGRT